MHCEISFFVLIICVLQAKANNEGVVGDSCVTESGLNGLCTSIHKCPSAIEDLQNNRKLKICNLDVYNPVVCCVVSKPEATCPPIDPSKTAPKTGQKAWDKCIEYQDQYMYPCKRSVVQSADRKFERIEKCKHSVIPMIVNGEDAMVAEFPHMALLGFLPDGADEIVFSCGGSVISSKFILTAGHCTHGGRLGPVAYALLGTLRRSDKYHSDNLYKIKTIIKHPNYAPPLKYHDIALLETDRPIKMYSNVVPACLDIGNQTADIAIATGWGATTYAGANADVLQKVSLAKFNEWECYVWHKPTRNMEKGFDPQTQICYGDKKQSKDSCEGDSGGPLQVYSSRLKCMYVIVGVTSFGRQCGHVGEPGVYTRVAEYVPWIESIIWP